MGGGYSRGEEQKGQEKAAWLSRIILKLPTPHFHTFRPTAASSACSAACPSSAARARCCEPAASACRGEMGAKVTDGTECATRRHLACQSLLQAQLEPPPHSPAALHVPA